MTRKKKRQRKRYSESFKVRAVRLAKASTRPVSQIARELQISEKTLHGWVHIAMAESETTAVASKQSGKNVEARVVELEGELARLRQRCAQLRLAAVYLAEGER